MIVYLSEHYWTAQLKDVPAVLRQKKVEQMGAQFELEGFPAHNFGDGFVAVSTAGQSLQEVYAFLQRIGAAAVTIEAGDIPNLLGRTVIALTLKRAIEQDGAAALGLDLLEPEELFDALQHAQFATLKSTDPETDPYATPDFDEAVALDDLREHGLFTDQEIARSNRSDPFAHDERSGIRSDQFGNLSDPDVSEFFPTGDPWGN
jgi:hypothetical protein